MNAPPIFPETTTGRSIHAAAFERAQKEFAEAYPGEVTNLHRDKLLESIVLQIAAGTTELGVLSHNAVRAAASLEAA